MIAQSVTRAMDAIQLAKIKTLICSYFGKNCNMATAIFTAESGLNPTAMGWNCRYTDTWGKSYSAACKKEDRGRAWSVDCGIAQINFPGLVCPVEAFDPEWNIKTAYYKKFVPSGWNPWVAWKKGMHLAFLE